MKPNLTTIPELELVDEAKIRTLLGNPPEKRFEASGVCVQDDACYVIFDNTSHLARFKLTESRLSPLDSRLFPLHSPFSGYEDIAYDPQAKRFFLLIEAQKVSSGRYQARIEEYDQELNFLSTQWADFPFKHKNKGLEGLTCVYLDERLYLLGLCEGNQCKGGAKGRRPGHGRIQVFARGQDAWTHMTDDQTAGIPALRGLRQPGCHGQPNRGSVPGLFPVVDRHVQGSARQLYGCRPDLSVSAKPQRPMTVYCNIEGVAWLAPDLILTVSDKRKSGEQAKRCKRKDQSLHIFRIPAA